MGSPYPLEHSRNIIVLFDGVCNLCNGAVQFIIRRDTRSCIRFASLQSDFGRKQLIRFGYSPDNLYTILVIEGDRLHEKSDAVFRIASQLDAPWRWMKMFKLLPRFIRDGVYDLVSRSRYKIFGQRDSCMIPTESLKARFLE